MDQSERGDASEFRMTRRKLPSEAFAISEGEDMPPTDPLDRPTWDHLVHLADDVSIRTSDHHGGQLRSAHRIQMEFVNQAVGVQRILGSGWFATDEHPHRSDPLDEGMDFVTDELEVSIYLVLTGYYVQSLRCLRVAVEGIANGAYFRAINDPDMFRLWLEGGDDGEIWPGAVRTGLAEREPYATVNGDQSVFIGRRTSWINELYHRLSAYSHGRPFTQEDGQPSPASNPTFRESNGPIYVPWVVEHWYGAYLEASLAALCLLGLAEPGIITASPAFPDNDPFPEFLISVRDAMADVHPGAEAAIGYLLPAGSA